MRYSLKMLLCAAASAGALSGAGVVRAADADADATTNQPSNAQVVVTAQRRSESVQAVPGGVTALTGRNLDTRGIVSLDQLQFAVPSVHVGTISGGTDITIRGVGATPVTTTGAPGVAVNVDGVYQTQTGQADLTEIDLSQVEVLRGPQGTLYGRNANAGVINFITNRPTDTFNGSILAGYASYDDYHLQGILNVPLSPAIRTRAVVDYNDQQQGFVKNILPGGESLERGTTLLGRFRLSADLTPDLEFDLGAEGEQDRGPWQYFTNIGYPTAAAVKSNPYLVNAIYPQAPWTTDANDPTGGTIDYDSVSGTFTWKLPFGQVKSITAYQDYTRHIFTDSDATNLSISPLAIDYKDHALTQEVDLNASIQNLYLVAGIFYLDESSYNNFYAHFPLGFAPLGPGTYINFNQPRYDTTSVAGFADGTYHIAGGLKLIGGIRYSSDAESATYDEQYGKLVDGSQVLVANLCKMRTDDLSFNDVTGRAGGQYDFDTSKNVYFTYSQGFKDGGVNIYSCGNDFKPEKIISYEGGFKSSWLNNTVTFNASAFYYQYSNFQLSQVVGLALLVTNAAAAEIKGVELEGDWTPDEHWTINASYTYLDATYTNFNNVDGLNPGLGDQNLDGHYLDNAPRDSVNVGVAYRTDEMSFGRITARADASYRSTTYFREFNTPLDSQKPYGLLNLNLIWDSPDNRYSTRLYATNVTNEPYFEAMGESNNLGSRYVTWGAPRQVGVEVRVRFQ